MTLRMNPARREGRRHSRNVRTFADIIFRHLGFTIEAGTAGRR
jgi:hypothetical protein